MTRTRLLQTLTLIAVLITACAPKATPDPNLQIRLAVASTLAAIPPVTSAPRPTSYPTPTPFSLTGLFCEYQFCIGHPKDIAFYDVSAQKDQYGTSSYSQGLLAAFNGSLLIQLMWQLSPGTSDPQFLLDLILTDGLDTPTGKLDVKLVRGMNLMFTPITTTATAVLPFGAAAAWTCGDRVFAWKVYTPQAESASPIFDNALTRFICEK